MSTPENIIGKRYGKLTIISYGKTISEVVAKCDCGKEVTKLKHAVLYRRARSCEKELCKTGSKDLSGQKFGFLEVIKYIEGSTRRTSWECLCICGNKIILKQDKLVGNRSKSCGCLKHELKPPTLTCFEVAINDIFSGYKTRATAEKISFSIEKEKFKSLILSECFYCGVESSNTLKVQRRTGYKLLYNGLDRVDSQEGYTETNVVPCCKNCNFAKRALSKEEFIALVKRIAARFP